MKVKRYVVDTMPDAMLSIRTELGSDAVILSTKEIKIGGFMGMFRKKKIEVVAAVENGKGGRPSAQSGSSAPAAAPQPQVPVPAVPRSALSSAYKRTASPASPNPAVTALAVNESRPPGTLAELAAEISASHTAGTERPVLSFQERPEEEAVIPSVRAIEHTAPRTGERSAPAGEEVLRELKEMKDWVQRLARQTEGELPVPEPLKELRERLLLQETESDLVDEWISQVLSKWEEAGRDWDEEQFREALRDTIRSFLAPLVRPGISPQTRVVNIAGPTGVGKTTTIAKLAAEQLFRGGRKVGLITADTYRISAVEQLRTYASILNIPLEVVQSPGDMQRAMSRLESCDLILMDTAGRNYRNGMLVAELQSLLAKEEHTETILVLSMTSKTKDMQTITEHFDKYRLDKLIFTKLDETESCGPLFNLLRQHPFAVAYITNGQNVPDDMRPASADYLVSLLLEPGGM